MTNTVNISRLLQDYIDALGVVQKELQEHDSASLYTFFDGARAYRDSFIDAGSGPIKKDYSIRLDIPDESRFYRRRLHAFGAEQHQHQKYRHRP